MNSMYDIFKKVLKEGVDFSSHSESCSRKNGSCLWIIRRKVLTYPEVGNFPDVFWGRASRPFVSVKTGKRRSNGFFLTRSNQSPAIIMWVKFCRVNLCKDFPWQDKSYILTYVPGNKKGDYCYPIPNLILDNDELSAYCGECKIKKEDYECT